MVETLTLTKEQVLERLKDSILTLARKGREFKDNKELFSKWDETRKIVNKAVEGLNSCDMLWLSEQYEIWFKSDKEMQDKLADFHSKYSAWVN